MRWAVLLLVAASACSSAPPPRVEPTVKDGKRILPVTPEEAQGRFLAKTDKIRSCYARERLNFQDKFSSYVMEVWIPNDGSPVEVEVLEETIPNQQNLRECLVQVFQRVRFVPHSGEPFTLRVPIKGPS